MTQSSESFRILDRGFHDRSSTSRTVRLSTRNRKRKKINPNERSRPGPRDPVGPVGRDRPIDRSMSSLFLEHDGT